MEIALLQSSVAFFYLRISQLDKDEVQQESVWATSVADHLLEMHCTGIMITDVFLH